MFPGHKKLAKNICSDLCAGGRLVCSVLCMTQSYSNETQLLAKVRRIISLEQVVQKGEALK